MENVLNELRAETFVNEMALKMLILLAIPNDKITAAVDSIERSVLGQLSSADPRVHGACGRHRVAVSDSLGVRARSVPHIRQKFGSL
jgi:hypothetical protein